MPRTTHACAKEGKSTGKGFGLADNLFSNEHKVEMERKRKGKIKKKKLKEKCKGVEEGETKV